MGKILLNPGPTNTSFFTKIKQWFGTDVCHRTEEFASDFLKLQDGLLQFYGDNSRAIAIMGGSGTTALEAMISSVVPDDCLFVDAGSYGKRAIDIARTYKIKTKTIKSKSADDLLQDKYPKYVYFVENETSTGEKYSLEQMCRVYPNSKFFIDATSAFGATNYEPYHDKIAAISFCSNKCLQSTPGLGIVIWNPELETHGRSFYGDLTKYGKEKMPFTVPVQSASALLQVISKQKNNEHLFNARMEKLIYTLRQFGIQCISRNPSNSVVAFVHPTKTYEELRQFLLKKNIVIYSGVAGINNSFRISTMSYKFDKTFSKVMRALNDSCIH